MFVVYQGVAIVAYLACLNIQTVSGQHEGSTERNCKYMKDETIIPSKDPFSVHTTKGIIRCLDKGCHANAKIVSYNTTDSSCSLYDGGTQNGGNRVDGASVYIDVSEQKNNNSSIADGGSCDYEQSEQTQVPLPENRVDYRGVKSVMECVTIGCHLNAWSAVYDNQTALCSVSTVKSWSYNHTLNSSQVMYTIYVGKVVSSNEIQEVEISGGAYMNTNDMFGPDLLFDGLKTPDQCEKRNGYTIFRMSHSKEMSKPYFLITLFSTLKVSAVKTWNRIPGLFDQYTVNMEIYVGDEIAVLGDVSTRCDSYPGIMNTDIQMFVCANGYKSGQYVKIMENADAEMLVMYEAEIYHIE